MLNSEVCLTKISTSKYACVLAGIFKGHGQLLDRSHDHVTTLRRTRNGRSTAFKKSEN